MQGLKSALVASALLTVGLAICEFGENAPSQEIRSVSRRNQSEINKDLVQSILQNSPEKFKVSLAEGADPKTEHEFLGEQLPALYLAAVFGSDEMVKELLVKGATWKQLKPDKVDDALISASCNGSVYVVQQLLKAGANPNATNEFGETPLKMSKSETCMQFDRKGNKINFEPNRYREVENILSKAGAT